MAKDELMFFAPQRTHMEQLYVVVRKEGAEAAAATGAVVMFRSLPPPTPVFKCDQPFTESGTMKMS